jgi:HPt (histidine-containing phosphotransfer) domain-containing protein
VKTDEYIRIAMSIAHRTWSPPELLLEADEDGGLITELIEAFTIDTIERMEKVRQAVATADFSKIKIEGHTIKGSARQIGAEDVALACQDLEAAAKAEDGLSAAIHLRRIQELFEGVRRDMENYSRAAARIC